MTASQPLVDLERSVPVHDCFLLRDAVDVRPARPAVQKTGEFIEFCGRAHRVNFHSTVIQVAGITGEPQRERRFLREIPVADALHPPSDEPPTRLALHGVILAFRPDSPPRQVNLTWRARVNH